MYLKKDILGFLWHLNVHHVCPKIKIRFEWTWMGCENSHGGDRPKTVKNVDNSYFKVKVSCVFFFYGHRLNLNYVIYDVFQLECSDACHLKYPTKLDKLMRLSDSNICFVGWMTKINTLNCISWAPNGSPRYLDTWNPGQHLEKSDQLHRWLCAIVAADGGHTNY